jgi:hypothetical protein
MVTDVDTVFLCVVHTIAKLSFAESDLYYLMNYVSKTGCDNLRVGTSCSDKM